jgi:hypothetical protein
MNEGDEAIESTGTRKKMRRSGFRYSNMKVLERSRVKRETAKVGGVQFEDVTRTLSYASGIGDNVHHDCAARSSIPTCLDSVEELDGDINELSCGDAVTYERCNIEVSYFYFLMIN